MVASEAAGFSAIASNTAGLSAISWAKKSSTRGSVVGAASVPASSFSGISAVVARADCARLDFASSDSWYSTAT